MRKRKGTYCPKNVSTPVIEVKARTPKTDGDTRKMEDVSFIAQEKQKSSLFLNNNSFKNKLFKDRKLSQPDFQLQGKFISQQK